MAPTLLLIPGAWHTSATFAPLAKQLESLGHPVVTAQLASVGSDSSTVAQDAEKLGSQYLDGLLADGKDVVVVAHSYAGFAVSPLLAAAAKKTRQDQGQKGGVIGIFFISAFVPPEGALLEGLVGGKLPPWQAIDEDTNTITVLDPIDAFYHDVASDVRDKTVSQLKHQSLPSFRSPAGDAGYKSSAYDGRRAYLYSENDHAIPGFAQKAMLEGSGVKWDVNETTYAHSCFLSNTVETGTWIDGLVKKWAS